MTYHRFLRYTDSFKRPLICLSIGAGSSSNTPNIGKSPQKLGSDATDEFELGANVVLNHHLCEIAHMPSCGNGCVMI